jgi:hypothetical protein
MAEPEVNDFFGFPIGAVGFRRGTADRWVDGISDCTCDGIEFGIWGEGEWIIVARIKK